MSYPKYQYQYFFHIRFLRIFYHDYSSKVAFDSLEEAENVNTQYKFSILNEIDESYKIDGKYEFLLNYSDINNCNWWRQTNFPLEETLSSSDTHVKGYEPLHISWKSNNFGGLEKTPFHFKYNCVPCLLDGAIYQDKWYYAIGLVKDCSNYNFIPADQEEGQTETTLYIRVPEKIYLKTCLKRKEYQFYLSFLYLCCIIKLK